MKLCINCQYYDRNVQPPALKDKRIPVAIPQPGVAMCLHPSTMDRTSLVTGKPVRYSDRAGVGHQRYVPRWYAVIFDRCGPKGRHFVEFQPSEHEGVEE
ncbi:hypothetical protein [Burkholderia cenocepacia]|uniref:Uncharacterized protein n=1 Tax=Burkholderia cenocepacia TaxID=95486 RepID=A0A6B2MNQ5_9BURK|nr:hypothetical protein [Burkholderia cenocepacia]NDV77065.1 hypothetical protein [Burkholderia cenocepacia]